MDAWESSFKEPTEDDRTARRVASLAIAFMNARRPLNTTQIRREFYPDDLSDVSFRKTFQRDRQRLAMTGIVLKSNRASREEALWEIDADSSFVKEGVLTASDALTLDMLLLPLASDPSFPYARDLRLALTKIDRAFDGSSCAAIPPEARKRNNNLTRLEDCMVAKHAARITYTRVDGTSLDRVVTPYGFFILREHTYMVAANPASPDSPPHTYRVDRVHSVREQARISYAIPLDFDIRDFILLPFQLGETIYRARLQCKDGTTRSENVSDEELAAAWCIAEDVVPIEPQTLVESWRRRLQNMAGDNNAGA